MHGYILCLATACVLDKTLQNLFYSLNFFKIAYSLLIFLFSISPKLHSLTKIRSTVSVSCTVIWFHPKICLDDILDETKLPYNCLPHSWGQLPKPRCKLSIPWGQLPINLRGHQLSNQEANYLVMRLFMTLSMMPCAASRRPITVPLTLTTKCTRPISKSIRSVT
jgi:hypothetical protein